MGFCCCCRSSSVVFFPLFLSVVDAYPGHWIARLSEIQNKRQKHLLTQWHIECTLHVCTVQMQFTDSGHIAANINTTWLYCSQSGATLKTLLFYFVHCVDQQLLWI